MEIARESKTSKPVLIILLSLIAFLLGFNFALSRYGAFWQKPRPEISTPPPDLPKKEETYIGCPVPEEYCKGGENVFYEGKVVGVGFVLPEGTPMLAVFDGEPRPGAGVAQDGTAFRNIYLTNNEGYQATYSFQGEAENLPFAVRKGEVIGRVNGKPVSGFGNFSLIFKVKKGNEIVPITSNSF
ncbi:MAG: hypothetical protein H5T64_11980 [Chloroflexi bacterium]|nr:hypothetical protein [Chloroflexota bacterium]